MVGSTQPLIAEGPAVASGVARDCPRCGEVAGELEAVSTSLSAVEPLRRCVRCGVRYGANRGSFVLGCTDCGLPFLSPEPQDGAEARCGECRAGRMPADLPDAHVAEATEREILETLERRWKFVANRSLSRYLDRLAREVATRIEGAPRSGRVVLFEDDRLRTLALPSGTLLISVGTLRLLEDEAELAFVLAHELAHAASAEAALRLVRLGLQAVSRGGPPADDSWCTAADDLIRLGHGVERERAADLRAIAAVRALGYDPRSVVRYLHRLQRYIEDGDPLLCELCLAHPPPGDRLRRIEKALGGRGSRPGELRVNREVFRRAAGPGVLANGLEPLAGLADGVAEAAEDEAAEAPRSVARPWLVWLLALLAAASGVAWLLLR